MPITEGTQPAAKTWTGAWTSAQTTASFVPESGALLVALVSGDGLGGGTPTTAAITDSLSGVWTLLKRQNTTTGTIGGTAEVWCRDSPGTSLTVSATGSGAPVNGGQLVVRTLLGAKATASQNGATNGATLTAAAVQVSVAAGTGNKIYGAAFNFTNSTNMTLLGNSAICNAFSDATNGDSWEAFKSSGDTAGTATYGYSTAVDGMIAAVEIIAAPAAAAGLAFNPGKTWKRRYRHRQRLPLAGGPTLDVRADTGLATIGLSTDSTAKKVAVVSAVSSLGLTATPVAKKVSKSTGIGTVGLASNFVHVDIRPVTAFATVGLTSTSTAKKLTPATLSGPVGLAGLVSAKKVTRPTLISPAGFTSLVTARKVTSATGRSVIGLQANFVHADIHAITALGGLGLTALATVKKRSTPLAAGTLGLSGNALPRKISKSTGLGEIPLATLAIVRKKQGITGRSTVGFTAWWEILPVVVGGDLYVEDRRISSITTTARAPADVNSSERTFADVGGRSRDTADIISDNRKTSTLTGG